jgi:Carboxypeptidase regulatory-like domain
MVFCNKSQTVPLLPVPDWGRGRSFATRSFAILVLTLGFLLCLTPAGFAQNATGTVLGHVTDSTGAVIPDATVTLTNSNTGVTRQFKTNGTGDFVFVDQNPGPYSLSVQAAGFENETTGNLQLEVEQTLRQNFSLKVGSQTQQVVVAANAQILQTDNETTGQVISGELISKLPLNGRDFTNLLQIGVGTTITPGGIQNTGFVLHGLNPAFEEVSINGARADSISYNVDGVTDTDFFFSAPTNIPGELAIEEFKTQNGLYGAEFGQGSAQVNVAIKSGTNSLHGAAYDFLQSSVFLPANEQQQVLNQLSGTNLRAKLPYTQNQFGATIGGPAFIPHLYDGKNRTFWFFSYDGGRNHQEQSPTQLDAPSALQRQGNFGDWPFPIYDPLTSGSVPATATNPSGRTQFKNNIIPTNRFDPRASALLTYFNQPNVASCTDLTTGCSNFAGSTDTSINTNTETFRVDQNFHDYDHVYFTGIFSEENKLTPSVVAGQGNVSFFRSRLFGLTWQHTFSSNSINQATLGYNRQHFYTGTDTAGGPNLAANAGFSNVPNIPAYYDLPSINFSTVYHSLGGDSPYEQWDNVYQGVDTVTLIRGRHTLSFGIDFRRTNLKDRDSYGAQGSLNFTGQYTASDPSDAGQISGPNAAYAGNPFADFLLGDVQGAGGPPPLGSDSYGLWGNNWNLFFQDDFRVTPYLTINAGLRWERPDSFHSVDNSGYAFNPANGGSLVWANRNFVTPILAAGGNPNYLGCCTSNELVPIDNKDFAPRIGFAFRPPSSDKLVIRGGYGIFYDTYNRYYDGTQFDEDALYNTTAAPYPNTTGLEPVSPILLSQLWATPLTADQGFSQPAYSAPFGQVYWPYNHNPYTQQFTLDTQYAITPTLLAEVGYVGTLGRRQPTQLLFNVANLPTVAGDPCNSILDASQAPSSCLSDPNFQPIDTREDYPNLPSTLYANANVLNSSYNSLQAQFIQRPWHGLQYHLNYTYSATLDESSGINNVRGEGGGLIQDPHHPGGDYGPAASDQRHRFVATYSYELPFGHGNSHSLKNLLIGGWTTSGIYQLASGFPFSVYGGVPTDQTADGYWQSRYRANYAPTSTAGFHSTLTQFFNTAAFSTPQLGRYGNSGKGLERTSYFTNFDASAGKVIGITDRQQLQIRVEAFNLTSTWHANTGLLFPDSTVTDSNFGSLYSNSQLGHANLFNPYAFQIGAQYTF